jgi:hypothetical protein
MSDALPEARIQKLEDIEAIKDLMAHYSRYVDKGYGGKWLETAPKIKLFPVTDARKLHSLSVEEQEVLFRELPDHLLRMDLSLITPKQHPRERLRASPRERGQLTGLVLRTPTGQSRITRGPGCYRRVERERSEAGLATSGLDWTGNYPVGLTDGPLNEAVEVRPTNEVKKVKGLPMVSRANVARVLLQAAEASRTIRQKLMVTSKGSVR